MAMLSHHLMVTTMTTVRRRRRRGQSSCNTFHVIRCNKHTKKRTLHTDDFIKEMINIYIF